MRFFIEELPVVFPYDFIYPEQLAYMRELKRGLDKRGHILLEMPSGTGKTISLLSLLVAYLTHHRAEKHKVVYCTRTVQEMSKTMEELKRLMLAWHRTVGGSAVIDDGDTQRSASDVKREASDGAAATALLAAGVGKTPFAAGRRRMAESEVQKGSLGGELTAVCLTARKNLCIHPEVSALTYASEVDAACRIKTARWSGGTSKCQFYHGDIEDLAPSFTLPPGVHTLQDLRQLGEARGMCPYFAARHAIETADILVVSYLYIVDPKVSPVVRKHLRANSIVVMDEGHNVDDVCIEAMSLLVSKSDAQSARDSNVKMLQDALEQAKTHNRQRLQEEYDRLVSGLALTRLAVSSMSGAAREMPALPGVGDGGGELDALPASLRHANQFVTFISRLADFFYRIISRMTQPQTADPSTFIAKIKEDCNIVDVTHLRLTTDRLQVLLNTLQLRDLYAMRHLVIIADFVTLLATHYKDNRYALPGYVVIFEPFDPQDAINRPDPVLRLSCVDASMAVRGLFEGHHTVVLTSGTLSPLDMYARMLGFVPAVAKSFPMTLSRRCICPVIVTRSTEQADLMCEDLTSAYKVRVDDRLQSGVSRAYAGLLLQLAQTVPDGIVCFFTGYKYMGEVMLNWYHSGYLRELSRLKLIFVETQDVAETAEALRNYRRACDIGRGAVFFSIARGKIAEGIDFDRHYGRAVVMFGVPFLPPDDRPLKERLKWMEAVLGITDSEFRNFDAVRQASQCIGRVLRNKTDYGMMILVDRRFSLPDKRKKLPGWIAQQMRDNTNLSTEACVSIARDFFVEMAQPWDQMKDLGRTLFDEAALATQGAMVQGSEPPELAARRHATPLAIGAPIPTAAEGGGRFPAAADGSAMDGPSRPIRAARDPTGTEQRRAAAGAKRGRGST